MKLFDGWLAQTRVLQEEAYGIDYSKMSGSDPANLNELIAYIRWNMLAVDDELAEMRQAISWKPWQHDDPYADRHELISEAVDVLHFVANMIVAAGGTDEMLNEAYLKKMEKNRARQMAGYKVKDDGVKCTTCTRALDEYDTSQCKEPVCPHGGDIHV